MQEQVFLLRRWRESEKEGWKWSLKDIKDGKTEFFVSEERLFVYMRQLDQTNERSRCREEF
jgi:hypothetical protein